MIRPRRFGRRNGERARAGAQPYFDVPADSLPDWQFNDPGFQLSPVLDLAAAGSGGGDPGAGSYPADMLIDWVRVW